MFGFFDTGVEDVDFLGVNFDGRDDGVILLVYLYVFDGGVGIDGVTKCVHGFVDGRVLHKEARGEDCLSVSLPPDYVGIRLRL